MMTDALIVVAGGVLREHVCSFLNELFILLNAHIHSTIAHISTTESIIFFIYRNKEKTTPLSSEKGCGFNELILLPEVLFRRLVPSLLWI